MPNVLQLLCLLLSLASLQAKAMDDDPFADREGLERRTYGDDTDAFARELLAALAKTESRKQPRNYLNIMSTLSQLDIPVKAPIFIQQLPEAKALARELKDMHAYCFMQAFDVGVLQEKPLDTSKVYDACANEARATGDPAQEALMKIFQSNVLALNGDMNKALKLATDALETASRPEYKDSILAFSARVQANIIYSNLGMNKESESVLSELIDYVKRYGMHGLYLTLQTNLVGTLVKQNEADTLRRAELILKEVIPEFERRQNDYGLANALSRYANLLIKESRFSEALSQAELARDIFHKLKRSVREADVSLLVSAAALGLNQYDRAEAALRTSLKLMDRKQFPADRAAILKALYPLMKKRGRLQEAYDFLDEWVSLNEEVAKKKAQEEFDKSAARIGLAAEKERNKILEAQNILQTALLQQEKQKNLYLSLVVIFGLLSMSVLGLSYRQSRKLAASRLHYQQVMEAINQGILVIDRHLQIIGSYSRIMTTFFPEKTSLRGQKFLELLQKHEFVDAAKISVMHSVLVTSFGETSLSWDLNSDSLPPVVILPGPSERTFEISWTPVYDKNERVESILVSMHDISRNLEMERNLQAARETQELLGDGLVEILKASPKKVKAMIDSLQQILSHFQASENKNWAELFRQLHLFKGNARSLQVLRLADIIHHLEDHRSAAIEGRGIHELDIGLRDLEFFVQRSQQWMRELPLFAEIVPSHSASLSGLVADLQEQLQPQLIRHQLRWGRVQVDDDMPHWNHALLEFFKPLLLQALYNSLDHGYIRLQPEQHGRVVNFSFRALIDARGICLEQRDYGAGVNCAALRAKVESLGFHAYSEAEVLDFAFQDGVSSAENLSETSGRGLGLSGIRSACRAIGGDTQLSNWYDSTDPKKIRGASLLLIVPLEHFNKPDRNSPAIARPEPARI